MNRQHAQPAVLLTGLLLMMTCKLSAQDAAPGRRLLLADYSTRRIAIVAADGKTEWEYKIGDLHDLHYLPNGNVLFQTNFRQLVEVDPKANKVVWQYDSGKANGNAGKGVEVHAFQRLADGVTMIAESGPARIIEVDRDGRLLREVKLQVARPHPHRDTRLARKLDTGNYLVCHEGEGAVREYNGAGKVVWDYAVPLFGKKPKDGHGPEGFGNACFAALRLKNGNTLISTGNGHSVLEVSPAQEIVWSFKQDDVKGIELGWLTTLQVLPSGNIVVGNCHAGKANPQLIEVNREKQVVWSFRDFNRFGNSTSNSQVLDVSTVSTQDAKEIDLFADGLKAFKGPKFGDWFTAESVGLDPQNPRRLVAKEAKGNVWVNGVKGRTNDLYTSRTFGDVDVHLEFVMAKGSNSGIKFHGHYEIQICDSFGKADDKLNGEDCGGVYPRAVAKPSYKHIDKGIAPKTNASKAPGEWQTLDISFLAPRFDKDGKKIANARLPKVTFNGKVIHDDVELKTPTGDRWPNPEMAEGPIMLQGDHGPVAFRNVIVRSR